MSAQGISQSTTFLDKLSDLFVHTVRLEVKHALAALLKRLSTTMTARKLHLSLEKNPALDYTPWYSILRSTYQKLELPKKSKKEMLVRRS